MNLGSRNKIKIEGGMSSMTDLVFLLLIFFIIMSLMSNNDIPVDLPKPADEVNPVQDKVTPTVVISEDNLYFVLPGEKESDARDLEGIKEKIINEVNNSGKSKLKIAGHRKADYDAVFQVLALAENNGWTPSLAYSK
jgi:biopolymer transport protein ExbD